MRALFLVFLASWCGCTPAVSPTIDGSAIDGGRTPCQTDMLINQSRAIRNPDGTDLVLPPCDAGGP
jgi:hypothetical protein